MRRRDARRAADSLHFLRGDAGGRRHRRAARVLASGLVPDGHCRASAFRPRRRVAATLKLLELQIVRRAAPAPRRRCAPARRRTCELARARFAQRAAVLRAIGHEHDAGERHAGGHLRAPSRSASPMRVAGAPPGELVQRLHRLARDRRSRTAAAPNACRAPSARRLERASPPRCGVSASHRAPACCRRRPSAPRRRSRDRGSARRSAPAATAARAATASNATCSAPSDSAPPPRELPCAQRHSDQRPRPPRPARQNSHSGQPLANASSPARKANSE